jgi:hypothetical protein
MITCSWIWSRVGRAQSSTKGNSSRFNIPVHCKLLRSQCNAMDFRLLDFVSISNFAQYCNRCCNLKHSLPFEDSPKKLLFTWWALVASSLIRASLSSIARSHASFLGCFGCKQNSISPTPFPERNPQCKWLQTNAHKLDLEHSGLGRSSHIDRYYRKT